MTGAERKNQWFRNRYMSGIATFIGYVLFRPRGPANQTGGFLSSIQTIHTILSRHAQFSCSFSSIPLRPVQRSPGVRHGGVKPHGAKERLTLPIVGVHPLRCRGRTEPDELGGVTIKRKKKGGSRDRLVSEKSSSSGIALVTLRNRFVCSPWNYYRRTFAFPNGISRAILWIFFFFWLLS